jgi:alpha-tubulin suppressor-like RCC1 family protein
LTSNVRDIFASDVAFAALKNDGSIVTWGNSSGGGDSSLISNHLQSDVISVSSTNAAFAALKKDGSVVTWGDSSRGGDSSSVSTVLNVVSGDNLVNEIIANDSAFSARLRDNSVVSWGDPLNGGNNSIVNSLLKTDILAFANPYIDDILGDYSVKTLKPLGESNSDQLINPLSNALLLAGLFSKPATANTLLSDIRLDLNDDGSVGVNDIQLMLRFSFGTFPNISLTDGLLPAESGFPNSTNIVQRLQTLNNI